jgi:putative tricarboxylic transport membrane protein
MKRRTLLQAGALGAAPGPVGVIGSLGPLAPLGAIGHLGAVPRLGAFGALAMPRAAVHAQPALPTAECIVPAKPGGGFDLGCQLARAALQRSDPSRPPLAIRYLPGGIGALAYRQATTQRAADAGALVAFSSGSLLNLVQGRFGPAPAREVRWVAGLGLDHGVIAVHRDAPWPSLGALLAALKASPRAIVFGAGGTIGSQDWMKAALLARAAGVGHQGMRFVAFEGGGDALSALLGGHVQVLAGDAAEVGREWDSAAPLRVLAVLADARLPGRWAASPTAREQGVDLLWPILRGFYVGPEVGDAEHAAWVRAFAAAMALPGFAEDRARAGLQPPALTGAALDAYIARQLAQYRSLAAGFGLPQRR